VTAGTSRRLDRCGTCSLLGERAADEMFGCTTDGLDPDSYGDQVALDGIMRDKARCEGCPHSNNGGLINGSAAV
jgi:hypothetical protein